jgi:hypothetical protein
MLAIAPVFLHGESYALLLSNETETLNSSSDSHICSFENFVICFYTVGNWHEIFSLNKNMCCRIKRNFVFKIVRCAQ